MYVFSLLNDQVESCVAEEETWDMPLSPVRLQRVIVSKYVKCCKAMKTTDKCSRVNTIPVPDPLD
jgi:hypothetical protein